MYRTVYCPDQSFMNEAITIAKEWGLPIQIGDSERTKEMDFKKTVVQVISVPTDRVFNGFPEIVKTNVLLKVTYINDYVECGNLKVKLTTEPDNEQTDIDLNTAKMFDVSFYPLDTHRILIPLIVSSPAKYRLCVFNQNELVDYFIFVSMDPRMVL